MTESSPGDKVPILLDAACELSDSETVGLVILMRSAPGVMRRSDFHNREDADGEMLCFSSARVFGRSCTSAALQGRLMSEQTHSANRSAGMQSSMYKVHTEQTSCA